MPDDNRTNGLQLDMMTHNTLLLQNIQESSSENNTYMKFLSFFWIYKSSILQYLFQITSNDYQ